MILIPTRRLNLLSEALIYLSISTCLGAAAYFYPTVTTHPLIAKVAGSLVLGLIGFASLVGSIVNFVILAKGTPALRADKHGIEVLSIFGGKKFYAWTEISSIAVETKRDHRSRGPDVVWNALVLRNGEKELTAVSERTCAYDLTEVVNELKRLPEAAERLDQSALMLKRESSARKLFSLRRLYLTALVCFIAYLTYRYWLLTH